MPPRTQWMGNDGYCGETSAQAAGLLYGQWWSQFDVRAAASGSQADEYLVGVNDGTAADAMRLSYTENPKCKPDGTGACARTYLAWLKAVTRKGQAATLCVYMNQCLFYSDCKDPSAGDDEYDHE